MAGCCEDSNEPSAFIRRREFLHSTEVLLASREGLCSMELVS
jgi:hypothetical protein